MKSYSVRMCKNGFEKTTSVSATSETNARVVAEQQNPGWIAVDIRLR